MVNISVQNKALKFSWFNRLLSDAASMQFWAIHLDHCFLLPLCDVLNCNIHHHQIDVLLTQKLPYFWKDVSIHWFKQFFVSEGCTTDEDQKKVLLLPVVFNSEIAVGQGWISPELYELLKEHDVLLLKCFLVNFVTTFAMINIVDPVAAMMIAQIRVGVPHHWNTLITQSVATNTQGPSLITDKLFAGLLTPKAFTSLLLPKVRNVKALEKWQMDLDCF